MSFSASIMKPWTVLGLIFMMPIAYADITSTTTFAIGQYADTQTERYANNLNRSKLLKIPDAEALEVTIKGETEAEYDYVLITDNERKKTRFSGDINEKFIVKGSAIKALFHSDGRTTARGVIIKVRATSLFNEIKAQLVEVSNHILKQGTREAYDKIVETLNEFKILNSQLLETQSINDAAEKIISALATIAQIYRDIAAMKEKIIGLHQTQLNLLAVAKDQVLANIEDIKEKEKEYQKLLDKAQIKLEQAEDKLEKQKESLSIEVYQKILAKMRKRQHIWKKFYEFQEALESKLENYSKKIALLFYFLNINAQLYEQANNVITMGKIDGKDLEELIDLSRLEKLVLDIENNEQEVKELIEKIQQTDES